MDEPPISDVLAIVPEEAGKVSTTAPAVPVVIEEFEIVTLPVNVALADVGVPPDNENPFPFRAWFTPFIAVAFVLVDVPELVE